MFTFFNTSGDTIFGTADFSDFSIYASLFKDLLPDFSRFSVFWDAIFFTTDKAGNIDLMRI